MNSDWSFVLGLAAIVVVALIVMTPLYIFACWNDGSRLLHVYPHLADQGVTWWDACVLDGNVIDLRKD